MLVLQPRLGLLRVTFALNTDLDGVVVGCDALDVVGWAAALDVDDLVVALEADDLDVAFWLAIIDFLIGKS